MREGRDMEDYVWIQTPDNWVSFFVELGVLWISRCLGNQARTTVHPLDFIELWLECQRALQRRNDLIGVPVSEGSVHGCVAPWTWTESSSCWNSWHYGEREAGTAERGQGIAPQGPPSETCFLQLGPTFYFFPPLNNVIMSGIHQGTKLFVSPEIS